MLFLVLLTIGPTSPLVKAILYTAILVFNLLVGKIAFNVNFRKYSLYLPLCIVCSIIFAMVYDIRNVTETNPYSLAGFAFLLPFVFCLFYIQKYKFEEFLIIFERVAIFLCICSLIGFAIQLVAPQIIQKLPTIVYYGRRYNSLLVYGAVPNWDRSGLLTRNCGCAWEPGAFQVLLNLGIVVTFKLNNKLGFKGIARIFLYIIAVASTLSTAGIIITIIVLIVNCFKYKKTFVVLAVLFLLFLPVFVYVLNNQIGKIESGTFDFRFHNSLYVIRNHWNEFLGLGSTGYNAIYSSNSEIGSWDLYTNLYLRYGLAFLILFVINILKLHRIGLSFLLVVAMSFLSESVLGPITVMLMYYSLQSQKSLFQFQKPVIKSGVLEKA